MTRQKLSNAKFVAGYLLRAGLALLLNLKGRNPLAIDVIVTLCGAAIVAGLVAGLFGLGGGVVVVPVVFSLLLTQGLDSSQAMPMAIATSLVCVFCTGLSSSVAHARYKHVDWGIVRKGGLALVLGATAGAAVVSQLRSPLLGVGFGVFLWAIALTRACVQRERPLVTVNYIKVSFVASVIGFISTLVGVGGGTMTVPALQTVGRPIVVAIGSSAVVGVILSFTGSLLLMCTTRATTDVPSLGLVYWPVLIVLIPAAMTVAPIGARWAKLLPEPLLKRGFIVLLFANGAWMIFANVQSLVGG